MITHEYARMIAERLLEASKDASHTHHTRPLAESILKNLDVLEGRMLAPKNTSLGEPGHLDWQVMCAEKILEEIVWRSR